MKGTFPQITKFARSKTPDEWRETVSRTVESLRVFVRDNGEKAALGAFGLGIFVVMFFKLFIVVAALIALAFLTVLWLSERP